MMTMASKNAPVPVDEKSPEDFVIILLKAQFTKI